MTCLLAQCSMQSRAIKKSSRAALYDRPNFPITSVTRPTASHVQASVV